MRKWVNSYLSLFGLSMLGESIFMFYASLNFLGLENGGFLTSLVFINSSIVRIVLNPFSGKLVDRLSAKDRWKYSIFANILLSILTFTPFFYETTTTSGLVIFFISYFLMNLFSNLDMQLRTTLPFDLEKNGLYNLSHYTSFSTLAQKGVSIIGPALGVFLKDSNWFLPCAINSLTFLIGSISSIIGIMYFSSFSKQLPHNQTMVKAEHVIVIEADRKLISNYNIWFTFFTNLMLGGVPLVLTLLIKSDAFYSVALRNPISVLFTGMAIGLIPSLLFKKAQLFIKNTNISKLNITFLLMSLLIFLMGFSFNYVLLILVFIFGILYGLILLQIPYAIRKKLQGKNMVSLLSMAQSVGRGGNIFIAVLLGFLIDKSVIQMHLFYILGAVGVTSFIVLNFIKRNLNFKTL